MDRVGWREKQTLEYSKCGNHTHTHTRPTLREYWTECALSCDRSIDLRLWKHNRTQEHAKNMQGTQEEARNRNVA